MVENRGRLLVLVRYWEHPLVDQGFRYDGGVSAPATVRFGPFELDLRAAELRKNGHRIRLQEQPFQILVELLKNPGEVVLREEIRKKLWPDNTVVEFDHSINAAVKRLRDSLQDSAENPRFVETLARRGYRFIAPVSCEPDRASQPAVPPLPLSPATPPIRHSGVASEAFAATRSPSAWKVPPKIAIGVVLSLLVVVGVGFRFKNHADRKWTQESANRVVQLAASGRYSEAYDLATQVLARDPSQLEVSNLMPELSDDLSVSTKPAGAEVYLRRLGAVPGERVGMTPIDHFRIPRAEYILSIRKAGYADFERTVSSALQRTKIRNKKPWELRIQQELLQTSKVPRVMVAIPGGEYRLLNISRPTETSVELADYFIDRFEVSNGDFKAFVDAGGYRNRQFWEPTSDDAQLGSAKEFTDKTGLPGPRGWIGGTFPAGKELYPVTGITWREARAYCRFRGQDLPTLFQWEKAAKPPEWTPVGVTFPWGLLDPKDVAKRANIDSTGLAPVNSFEFGMSHFGAYNTAGNAAEWIRNRYGDGYTVAGGAWNDPPYGFLFYRAYPALYSSETVGCRCAMTASSTAQDQGGMPLPSTPRVLHYPVSSDQDFQASAAHYTSKKTPLNAVVLGVKESDSWRREEVAFAGEGGQPVKAFLYLPKTAAPPYQMIHYLSGLDWWFGVPVTSVVEAPNARLSPYLRAGRALFLVVLDGFDGRNTGKYANFDPGSREYADAMISWVGDMQRGFDYLETRSDIDRRKIAFRDDSTYEIGIPIAALNQRYASVILVSSGAASAILSRLPPDINPFHFAPHIAAPTLMLNGRYDDVCPEISVTPLFDLLQAPKKRLKFEGAHMPAAEVAVPIIDGFLDETLGPVRR